MERHQTESSHVADPNLRLFIMPAGKQHWIMLLGKNRYIYIPETHEEAADRTAWISEFLKMVKSELKLPCIEDEDENRA